MARRETSEDAGPAAGRLRVLGLISGTSVDRIEVAAAEFHVEAETAVLHPLGHLGFDYPADLRAGILATLPPAPTTMETVARLDNRIGRAFADAAVAGLERLAVGRADLIVSHGQNVFHWVEGGRARGTLQLGQPAWIAERTGLPVVSNVRARDVAAGGHGAPLVSLFDQMLLGSGPPRAALNLGGIANITVVGAGRDPIAFDTGPANALMDGWISLATGGAETMDAGGRRAARGSVDERLLEELLKEPYYSLPPPKSTGRELFSVDALRGAMERAGAQPDLDDALATLAELSARTVAGACRSFGVTEVFAAGGGTDNPTLMSRLGRALGPVRLTTIDEVGIPAVAKEAYAFALIGFMTAHGWPAIAGAATGAHHPSVLGSITPGAGPLRLPISDGPAPTRLVIR